jgi:hypothetical protein
MLPGQPALTAPTKEDPFAVVHEAAARVTEARRVNGALRLKVDTLLAETLRVEAIARLTGDKAIVMPEDLGEWEPGGPRVAGLVARIRQVHAQSTDLVSATTATVSTPASPTTESKN